MIRSLERLLRPKSVAVIGGGAFGTNVVRQCLKVGFAGEVWPVHPTRPSVEGLPAYPTVEDLPSAPDAAFIGVNRFLTIPMVRALREKGAGGAICFAAGFLETGAYDRQGARLQAELIEAAGAMPVIGPNCYGLINYADGALLWPDQHGGKRLEGGRGVAILTQSSNIACNITMQKRGLPLAFLLTAGNQAQTGLSAMALGLLEDERVSALGLHIEGFDSVAGFERLAARAKELGKPIAAMKVGRSEAARAATVSHTASLAGTDAASAAFLRRLGIARVHSIPALLETLKLLHGAGPLGGTRISSMSCSGGEASVMADTAEGRAVRFPPLDPAHRTLVQETLGPLVAVANPLDYHTFIWNDRSAMTRTFSAFTAEKKFDINLLVLDFPRTDRCSDADWWTAVDAFEAALKANGAKGAIVASMGENLSEEHAEDLFRRGIVPLQGIEEAFDAAEAAAFIGEAWKRLPSPLYGVRSDGVQQSESQGMALGASNARSHAEGQESARSDGVGATSAAAQPSPRSASPIDSPHKGEGKAAPPPEEGEEERQAAQCLSSPPAKGDEVARAQPETDRGETLQPHSAQSFRTLTEAAAKALLRQAGLPVPSGLEAATTEEAVAAVQILGFPVALKSLGVAHKSEAGAVRLNLADEAALRQAAHALLPLGGGLYVERMVLGGVAELIVGITRDPVFGAVLTIGTGGVLVELLQDTATLLLPASRVEIEAALRRLKLFPLLEGFRGRPKADLAAALDAVQGIAAFALAQAGALEELDVNPLIVCREGEGAHIADALMVVREG